MDRNTIIGLVLIFALVVTWFFVVGDQSIEEQETGRKTTTTQTDTVRLSDNEPIENISIVPDSGQEVTDSMKALLADQQLRIDYGDFAAAASGEEKDIVVSTDRFTVRLNTLGGKIKEITLNPEEFVTYDQKPLSVQTDHPENMFGLEFQTRGDRARIISTEDLYFTPVEGDKAFYVKGEEQKKLTMRAAVDANRYLDITYTFTGDKYDIGMDIAFVGMEKSILKNRSFDLHWVSHLPLTERSMKEVRAKSAIFYREGSSVEDVSATGDDPEIEKGTAAVDWVGYKNHFFTQTLMANEETPFSSYDLTLTTPINDSYVKRMESRLRVDGRAVSMAMYAGPMDYKGLKSYDRKLERQIDLGYWILKYVNAWVIIPLFSFLEGAVGNYGIIILILAIFIKLIVFPMTYKSYISMAKMRVINNTPEIKTLEEKYKDDSTKLQQEKMSYYRKVGVSPFGGCLPMILQYPILISMFFFFPNSIELRQQSFLWATDLSTYDSILDLPFTIPAYGDHISLFTVLMAVSLMFFTIVNQKSQGTVASNPVMKYMPYFMPIMLLVFLNNYSAGLSYYYLLSNLISIGQTTLTKRFVDDEKLLEQLRAKQAKKSKDGGKGKGRMEKWMENQQKKQRDFKKGSGGARSGGKGSKRR